MADISADFGNPRQSADHRSWKKPDRSITTENATIAEAPAVKPWSGLQCYIIFCIAMLYLSLYWKIMPMSGMQCYTQVWFEFLYLHPLWILLGFTKLIESVLYLLLVCNIIPTSVMATFAFTKLEFRLVIPMSGTGKISFIPSSVISTYGTPLQDIGLQCTKLKTYLELNGTSKCMVTLPWGICYKYLFCIKWLAFERRVVYVLSIFKDVNFMSSRCTSPIHRDGNINT